MSAPPSQSAAGLRGGGLTSPAMAGRDGPRQARSSKAWPRHVARLVGLIGLLCGLESNEKALVLGVHAGKKEDENLRSERRGTGLTVAIRAPAHDVIGGGEAATIGLACADGIICAIGRIGLTRSAGAPTLCVAGGCHPTGVHGASTHRVEGTTRG